MKTPLLLGVLVVMGAGLAWFLTGSGNTPPASPDAAITSRSSPPPSSPATARKTSGSPSPALAPAPPAPPTDTETECRRVLAISSPAERQLAFVQLLAATRDEAGLRAMLDVFTDLYQQGKRHGTEWFTFWAEMVARDPTAATNLSATYNRNPEWLGDVAPIIAQEWAAKDPEAAIAWLANNATLSDADLDQSTLALLSGYARRDISAATGYALSVIATNDPLFGDMAYVLSTTALQKGGTEGLFAWFEALPDDALKHRLFPSVSNRLERVSLEARANWLASQSAAHYRNDQVYRDFVGAWAKDDPAAAMAWVFELPPSPKDGSMVGVGYAAFPWLEKDPQGFRQYYRNLPPARQQEVARVIRAISADAKMPEGKRRAGLDFLKGLP